MQINKQLADEIFKYIIRHQQYYKYEYKFNWKTVMYFLDSNGYYNGLIIQEKKEIARDYMNYFTDSGLIHKNVISRTYKHNGEWVRFGTRCITTKGIQLSKTFGLDAGKHCTHIE